MEAQINDIKSTDKYKTAEKDYIDGVDIKIRTAAAPFTPLSAVLFL